MQLLRVSPHWLWFAGQVCAETSAACAATLPAAHKRGPDRILKQSHWKLGHARARGNFRKLSPQHLICCEHTNTRVRPSYIYGGTHTFFFIINQIPSNKYGSLKLGHPRRFINFLLIVYFLEIDIGTTNIIAYVVQKGGRASAMLVSTWVINNYSYATIEAEKPHYANNLIWLI
jgi:hypothetical protein